MRWAWCYDEHCLHAEREHDDDGCKVVGCRCDLTRAEVLRRTFGATGIRRFCRRPVLVGTRDRALSRNAHGARCGGTGWKAAT